MFFGDVSYGVWSCKKREDCPAILPSTLIFMEVLPVPQKVLGEPGNDDLRLEVNELLIKIETSAVWF